MTPKETAGKGRLKRPYEKPRVRVIELNSEETLQEGCKMEDSGTAPGGFTCTSNNCGKAGS